MPAAPNQATARRRVLLPKELFSKSIADTQIADVQIFAHSLPQAQISSISNLSDDPHGPSNQAICTGQSVPVP